MIGEERVEIWVCGGEILFDDRVSGLILATIRRLHCRNVVVEFDITLGSDNVKKVQDLRFCHIEEIL